MLVILEDHSALAEAASTAEVRRRLLDIERAEPLRLYRERDIDDDVLRALQQQLDIEDATLAQGAPLTLAQPVGS